MRAVLVALALVVLALLGLSAPTGAQCVTTPCTQQQLLDDINTKIPSGRPDLLTAASLRAALDNIVLSLANPNLKLASYGAACDGVTNDDTAITAWIAATVAVGKPAYFSGTCRFNTPIVLPAVDGVTIVGDSPGTSILLYQGSNTTSDIISIGTAGVACCAGQHRALHFQNWQLKSNTSMTGGAAMHFQQIVRSDLLNWWACTQDCTNNFYHGVWFDQVDTMRWCGINAQAKQDVVRVNAQVGGPNSDFWLDCGGKISGGAVGVRIGGGFGGFTCQTVDIIANTTNMWVDTSLTSAMNTQIFVGPMCPLDTAGSINFRLSDTLGTETNSLVVFTGPWLASSISYCLWVESGVNFPIQLNGGTVINCGSDGIHNDSSTARIFFLGTRIVHNVGYGVFSVAPTGIGQVFGTNSDLSNNGSGNTSANVILGTSCASGSPSGSFSSQYGAVTHC